VKDKLDPRPELGLIKFMKQYLNRFWILITVLVCVAFIAVFLPLSIDSIGMAKAISYTLTGVAVIWIVYFIRSYIITGFHSKSDDENNEPSEK
jgi:hypothetical protein